MPNLLCYIHHDEKESSIDSLGDFSPESFGKLDYL